MQKISKRFFSVLTIMGLVILFAQGTAFGGGKIRMSVIGDPISIDPAHLAHTQDRTVAQHVYQGLVTFDLTKKPPFPVVPVLAKSYEVSEDGKMITFKLHQGVQFHGNYGELTSEDVVFSLSRHLDKKTASRARSQLKDVDRFEAPDKYTVIIHLKIPAPLSLIRNLAWQNAGLILSKKATLELGDKIQRNPIGTGPFYFAKYDPGEKIILKKFDGYWKAPPKFDEMELWNIKDHTVALGALEKGDLDVVPITGRGSLSRAEKLKDARIVEAQGGARQYLFYLNHQMKPLDDLRVRQALAHALDLKKIAKRIGPLAGYFPSPVSPVVFSATDKFWKYDYDLEKAKKLLKEAGYPKGFDLKIIYYRFDLSEPIVLEAQAAWSKIVNVKLEYVEKAVFRKRLKKFNHHMAFWAKARYAPYLFAQSYVKDSPVNYAKYSNPKIDEAITKAKTATTEQESMKYWQEFQKHACDDVFNIWMANGRSLAAVRMHV